MNNTFIQPTDNFEDFVKDICSFCQNNNHEQHPLKKVTDFCKKKPKGLCLEFGVYKGESVNYIAEQLPQYIIFGFDSFQGLPEDWVDKYTKGSFDTKGTKPIVKQNVALIEGFFNQTLPEWINNHPEHNHIDLLHIDSDLYSSAKTILNLCKHMISDETLIVFDELINYKGFEQHEIKALYEFCKETNRNTNIFCFGGHHKQKVAVFVKSIITTNY